MSIALVKPEWLKIRPPTDQFTHIKTICQNQNLTTVCQKAHCPNIAECWSGGTATFMIMGDTCTRGCQFCAVRSAKSGQPLDPKEPQQLAQAIKEMKCFDYVVLTSVNRDDLQDQGANHFAACIREIKKEIPGIFIEVLIPDFHGDKKALQTIIDAEPDVIAHNIETIKRLQPTVRDRRASYEQSLYVLSFVKQQAPHMYTKSSLMVGLGETNEEILDVINDLRKNKVDIVTFGQYLKPKNKSLAVKEFVTPETFKTYKQYAIEKGFLYAASGPFVRSSYKAGELFLLHHKRKAK